MFIFLPITLGLYFILPNKWLKAKNLVLLFTSLFFYAWGEPIYVLLMMFSIMLNWGSGMLFANVKSKKWRLVYLLVCVGINLGMLGVFKYAGLFVDTINGMAGEKLITMATIALPIGISFYTFQAMSYSIDVYRGDVEVQRSPFDLGAYVTMFPQLIAGPIVRYSDVAEMIKKREHTWDKFGSGARRFIMGLAKKVICANLIGSVATAICGNTAVGGFPLTSYVNIPAVGELSVLTAWVGILAFTFQIYFDFSGYSDMAIGMGRMMGFEFLENFDYPYVSKSVTEFWRRWHMSLGTWFRDYVYFPMGGSRVKGKGRLVFNLLVVWALTGFWHGANWNFLAWGMFFGIIISLEKLFILNWFKKLKGWFGGAIQWLYAFVLVVIGWVLFNFLDFSEGWNYFKVMFGFGGAKFFDSGFLFYFQNYGITMAIVALAAFPWWRKFVSKPKTQAFLGKPVGVALSTIMYAGLLFICITSLVSSTFNPFIYFQF